MWVMFRPLFASQEIAKIVGHGDVMLEREKQLSVPLLASVLLDNETCVVQHQFKQSVCPATTPLPSAEMIYLDKSCSVNDNLPAPRSVSLKSTRSGRVCPGTSSSRRPHGASFNEMLESGKCEARHGFVIRWTGRVEGPHIRTQNLKLGKVPFISNTVSARME